MVSALLQAREESSLRLRIAGGCGITGLALMFALGLRSPTAMYAGLFLTLLGLVVAADRALPALLREPLFWAAIVLFTWVLVRGWIDLETATARGLEPDDRAVWHHARFTLLLPLVLAFWLAAFWRHRHFLLVLIGVSALVYVVNDWDRLMRGLPGGESPFSSAFGEAGIIAATVFFLTGATAIDVWRCPCDFRPATRIGLLIAAGALTLFALAVFFAAQARAAWLAMIVTLLLLGLWGGWFLLRHADRRQRRTALMAVGGGLALFGVFVVLSWDILSSRLLRDTETIAVLLAGNVEQDDVPGGSFGARYRMFRQALIDIGQNPLWGVGPGSVRDMLHEIWGQPRGGSGNYHSTWLNLLVAMGIPWTVFWLGLHLWAVARCVRWLVAQREAVLAVGLLGAFLVHFGTLTFQGARLWSVQGSALYLILMTVICAVLLREAMDRRLQRAAA